MKKMQNSYKKSGVNISLANKLETYLIYQKKRQKNERYLKKT